KGNIRSIWTNKDSSINFNIVSMLICADTIFYRGIEELPVGTVKRYNPDWIVGMPARYKGDLKLMESRVAEEYAEIQEGAEIDSVVVFEGTVNKRGSLYDVALIAGKRSVFSDLVQKAFVPPKDEFELLPPREDWFPAGIDRG